MPLGETIVAPATPNGQSAIALIRASGPAVNTLTEAIFGTSPTPRHATLGHYIDSQGTSLDQVLFTLFPAHTSYTGEDLLEIASHGNPLIVQKITEDLVTRGCRLAEGGEFTRTAFLNNKLDLAQAEAVCDLITARSERALKSAQNQLAGAIGEKIDHYTQSLLQTLAEVEAYIDFPEEDLPSEDTDGPLARIILLIADIQELIKKSHYKNLLQEGIKTAIIGPPNAGKSSLLNALIGEDRAIVSPTPGTTRDFISESVMIGPFNLRIIDTAGLHSTQDALEQLGIEKSIQKAQQADFHILVLDSTQEPPTLAPPVLNCLTPQNTLILLNKTDLGTPHPALSEFLPHLPRTQLSLKTEDGLPEFRTTLQNALQADVLDATAEDLIINARHATAFTKAKECLEKSLQLLRDQEPTELAAAELHLALEAFGQVIGKVDNERILDKLFATFCIGK